MDSNSTPAAALPVDPKSAARSCITCSKAKAKCVRQHGQDVCERCHRLKKECRSRDPVQRRRKATKTTRTAQLEKLENKIEHLVNALSTSQTQRSWRTNLGHPSPPTSERFSQTRQQELLNSLCETPEDDALETPVCTGPSFANTSTTPGINSTQSSATSPATTQILNSSLTMPMPELEVLLDRYKRLMSHALPFVLVHSHTTAAHMTSERPFLLQAIVTVTYFHDLSQQQRLVRQFIRDASERVFIKTEKSLDIVQGLLVMTAWYHSHVFWCLQMTNLLYLAIAVSSDLGIDRPSPTCGDIKHSTTKAIHGTTPHTRVPNLDEHRTLAGLYYLTSMLSSSFKRLDAVPFTKFLSEALNSLEQANECESDLFLVQLVRLQHLGEEIHTSEPSTAPTVMYTKAFSIDLEHLRQRDPNQKSSCYLELQYRTVEILLWELSLNELLDNKTKPLRQHIDNLCNCVQAIKAFLEIFFTIPVDSFLMAPFSVFGQLAHALIVLTKIASLEIDGWDMRDLREQAQFIRLLDQVADRFEHGAHGRPDGLTLNNESLVKWSQRIRWMKQIYESKFVQNTDSDNLDRSEVTRDVPKPPAGFDTPMSVSRSIQQAPQADDAFGGEFFNYLDENFWQSFGGEVDFGFPEMAMG